jgi:hypothetical protein
VIWKNAALEAAKKRGGDFGTGQTTEAILEELIDTQIECTKALVETIASRPGI